MDSEKRLLLHVENLTIATKDNPPQNIIENINLTIEKGDIVGIVGESGCGKSTLAYSLMGYKAPNLQIGSGAVYFGGKNLFSQPEKNLRNIRGKDIAMVFQNIATSLTPSLTVGYQLQEVFKFHDSLSKKERYDRCIKALSDVALNNPEKIYNSYPHQMSGGQQQRVVIAMALLLKPEFIILDEPTTGLDTTVEAEIIKLLKRLKEEHDLTYIFISHNLHLVAQFCSKALVMYCGQVIEEGSCEDIFNTPKHPYSKSLISCLHLKKGYIVEAIEGQVPPLNERPQGCYFGPRCDFYEKRACDQNISLDLVSSDHSVRCWKSDRIKEKNSEDVKWVKSKPITDKTLLTVENLSKTYSQKHPIKFWKKTLKAANKNISFNVHEKEIVAIVGESGSGKSTLAKQLLGLIASDKGHVTLQKSALTNLPLEKRPLDLLKTLQIIFQNPDDTLNPYYSISYQVRHAIKSLRNLNSDKVGKETKKLLKNVNLSRSTFDKSARFLSGGEKQRASIARAFSVFPKLIVADEPLSALDVSVQAAIVQLLLDMKEKYNTSLIFISHDLHMVNYLADRVIVMFEGEIVEQGSTENVFKTPNHDYTKKLIAACPNLKKPAN